MRDELKLETSVELTGGSTILSAPATEEISPEPSRSAATDEPSRELSVGDVMSRTARRTLPQWAPDAIEQGAFYVSSFLAANRAGCNERRPLACFGTVLNALNQSEKSRGRTLAKQPLSRWAKENPVKDASAAGGLLRRAAGGRGVANAASYAVEVRMPPPHGAATTPNTRYYTLVWGASAAHTPDTQPGSPTSSPAPNDRASARGPCACRFGRRSRVPREASSRAPVASYE
jgi:hypothetical protein